MENLPGIRTLRMWRIGFKSFWLTTEYFTLSSRPLVVKQAASGYQVWRGSVDEDALMKTLWYPTQMAS